MTNRDPNVPDFIRKVNDFYDCLADYYKISDIQKLSEDKKKQDIDLVCFYELSVIRQHVRETGGLNYNDFIKLNPKDEQKFLKSFH